MLKWKAGVGKDCEAAGTIGEGIQMKLRNTGRMALGCMMAGIFLWGCRAEENVTERGPDGSYTTFLTVDVYAESANYQGIQSGWFAKVVKDRFNMELNIIAPNVAGGGQTLYQTRAAAGNLGDLIFINTSNGRLADLVEAGVILDCTELMEGKDILENYGDAIRVTNEMVPQEGMWAFPNSVSKLSPLEPSEGVDLTFGPYIRWDYYKMLGYPEIPDLDGFLDVLEQMQQKAREVEGDSDIYAISLFKDWDGSLMNNAKQLACMYGYDEIGFVMAKADDSDMQNAIDEDSIYIRALRFLYEANRRGLVDPDSTTQNYDSWAAKYVEGKILYCPWPWVGQNLYNTAERKAEGKGFMMAPLQDMTIFSFGNCPEGNTTQVAAIGSKARDPQRMADFIDWLYSPEGVELNGQANGAGGIRGLTWDVNEEGKPCLTEYGLQALPMNPVLVPQEYGGGTWSDGVSALNFKTVNLMDPDPATGEPYYYLCWDTTLASNSTALDLDWKEKMGAETTVEYLKKNGQMLVAPGSSYSTPKEEPDITTIRGQCNSVVADSSWRMIFSGSDQEFEEILREMQETAIGLGYEQVLEVDLKNARDQAAARRQVVRSYEAKQNGEETDEIQQQGS